MYSHQPDERADDDLRSLVQSATPALLVYAPLPEGIGHLVSRMSDGRFLVLLPQDSAPAAWLAAQPKLRPFRRVFSQPAACRARAGQ